MRVYIDGAPEKRHERHLMRQRGAGARALAPTFGFTINATKRTVPLATGFKTPSRTPMRKRLSMVARTPSKTPVRTPSRALSKTPATAGKSPHKVLEPIQPNIEAAQDPEHDELPAKTPVKTSTKTPAKIMSKTPSRTPFIYKRKMTATLIGTTRKASPAPAELVTEKVVAEDDKDTNVETKDLQSLPVTDNVLPVVEHEDVEPAIEEIGTMILHEDPAPVEQPIETEEVRIEPAAEQYASVPIEHDSEGELLEAAETVNQSTPAKKAPAQRKTNRRKRKPVTMPKPRRKVVAKKQIDPVKEENEDDIAEKQIQKAPAKSRATKVLSIPQTIQVVKTTSDATEKDQPAAGPRKSTREPDTTRLEKAKGSSLGIEKSKELKASKKAGPQKQAALVAAGNVKQSNKRKPVEEETSIAVQPTKRMKVEESAAELPVESAKFRQSTGREKTEPATVYSPATRTRPAPSCGMHSNDDSDTEEAGIPGIAEMMLKSRQVSGADARTARIRAGRRRMWRDESSSNSVSDALFDPSVNANGTCHHTLLSPARSILSQRDSNSLTPSPAKVRQLLKKQKVILSTTRGDRTDKENASLEQSNDGRMRSR
ncbi:hypothetical protein MBLNU457_4671t1 [Dothideomycetes sp. NU457]